MSPGQTGHITGQMGRVPGTDGTHTRGCPAKILYVYWFFSFPSYALPWAEPFLGFSLGILSKWSISKRHMKLQQPRNRFSRISFRVLKGGLFRKGVARFLHSKPRELRKPREPRDEF